MPQDGDLVINKHAFSPFVETDIADRLRALGIERLLVGGVGSERLRRGARCATPRGAAS